MRIAVTGRGGQVSRALQDGAAALGVEVVAVGRPELNLERPETVETALRAAAPDAIVSAAAYTAVDQAEAEPERAHAVNAVGAGAVASAARALGAPLIHLSTDYVFDGSKPGPYVETDPVAPLGVYGRTKLAGERAAAAAQPDHVILRTAWVYAAGGKNFVRTMLRLAESRDELSVVADQVGSPTYAPHIAAAVTAVARRLLAHPGDSALRGVFHLAGSGATSWADFAAAIFALSKARGGPAAAVRPITTAEYPTPARRPANSRLDCARLADRHGVVLPPWPDGLAACLDHLIGPPSAPAA